jgi:hypothetical protein
MRRLPSDYNTYSLINTPELILHRDNRGIIGFSFYSSIFVALVLISAFRKHLKTPKVFLINSICSISGYLILLSETEHSTASLSLSMVLFAVSSTINSTITARYAITFFNREIRMKISIYLMVFETLFGVLFPLLSVLHIESVRTLFTFSLACSIVSLLFNFAIVPSPCYLKECLNE